MKELFLIILIFSTVPLVAQDGNDIESASLAVEKLLDKKGSGSILKFMSKYMPGIEDQEVYVEKIEGIRKELAGLRDGIGLDVDDEGAILSLSAEGVEKRLRIQYDWDSQQVTDLFVLPLEEKLVFDSDNLDAAISFMEDQAMAGLIYMKKDGSILIKKGFGMANEALNVPNSASTIFAIGSRPIDFTTAAILLLDQEGVLSFDDPISKHLSNVPADKQTMTLRHLMSGASGLPDFFDIKEDWDPDLQWVSRDQAIKRMMNQTLLFEPGAGEAHSHGAFGLLAAIVELRSGQSYMEFLEANFFEPAGMNRTGEYGDKKDFAITDFAVGGGPQHVGIPNIPPNWGPTSWLVKGSGGMYSTLDDLLKFYAFLRDGDILDAEHAKYFTYPTADVDGSMRGFELFSVYNPPGNEVFLFLNQPGEPDMRRKVFRAFEALIW